MKHNSQNNILNFFHLPVKKNDIFSKHMSSVRNNDIEFFISWMGFKVSPRSFSVPSELTGDRKSKKNNVPKKHTAMRTVKTKVLVASSKWFLSRSAIYTNVLPKNILESNKKHSVL